jgi:hypothetical protein
VGVGFAAPQIDVTVDSSKVIGVNNFSLGFALGGDDIRIWRDRSVLRELARDASFKLVRFFPQRLSEPLKVGPPTWSWDWSLIDDLVDKIIAIGAEPMPVLGFCGSAGFSSPSTLPRNPNTAAPYPADFAAYCRAWVSHFGNKITWYEVINEPHHYFGWGTSADPTKLGYFMDVFNAAARAMRAQNPNIKLGNDNSMIPGVRDYFIAHGEPLDFLSWHRYQTGNKA